MKCLYINTTEVKRRIIELIVWIMIENMKYNNSNNNNNNNNNSSSSSSRKMCCVI